MKIHETIKAIKLIHEVGKKYKPMAPLVVLIRKSSRACGNESIDLKASPAFCVYTLNNVSSVRETKFFY
jgi:hypothetical protein